MTTLETIRTVQAHNKSTGQTVTLSVLKDDRGYWLHDHADVDFNGLDQIQDESDTAIMDSIRDNGFEIVA